MHVQTHTHIIYIYAHISQVTCAAIERDIAATPQEQPLLSEAVEVTENVHHLRQVRHYYIVYILHDIIRA